MGHMNENHSIHAGSAINWLREGVAPFDVVEALLESLQGDWLVERETDPAGDLSVIVMSVRDDAALPTFLLYEEDGLAQVATVSGDTWRSKSAYPTCQRAVAAIAAAVERLAVAT